MSKHEPITRDDIHEGRAEMREWHTMPGGSRKFGRSTMVIQCPFCKNDITVYLWSFAGCGKRCDCGARLDVYGTAYKLRTKKKSCKHKKKLRVSKKAFRKMK